MIIYFLFDMIVQEATGTVLLEDPPLVNVPRHSGAVDCRRSPQIVKSHHEVEVLIMSTTRRFGVILLNPHDAGHIN